MRLSILLSIACCLSAFLLPAQKFIQLEKTNRAKVDKFYVGQPLTFRLKGDPEWHTEKITDVQMDSQRVAFDLIRARVSDFEAIRLEYPGILRNTGPALMIFGASWGGFALVGVVFDEYKLTAKDAIVTGTGLVSGFILNQIFKNKNIKLNDRRRLRAVEVPVAFPLNH
ncbi:MAG: hypothetical protein ACKVU2_02735 [Saprospiraceae bacterium]